MSYNEYGATLVLYLINSGQNMFSALDPNQARCNKCGHLPLNSACHNCSNELEDSDDWSVDFLNKFYTTRDAGYGKTAFAGLLIVIISPLISVIGIVTSRVVFDYTASSIPNVYGLIILSGVSIIPIVGSSIYLTSWNILLDHVERDNLSKGGVFIKNFGLSTILSFIIFTLLAIPVINLAPLAGYFYLIVIAIRHYRRGKINRFMAVSSLLEGDSSHINDSHIDSLTLLLIAPASEITVAQRNFVIEYFSKNPKAASYIGKQGYEQFLQAVETAYSHDEENRIKLIKVVLASGQELRSNGQFEEAKSCFKAADQLATEYNIESYHQRAEKERIATENLDFVDSFVSDEKIAQLSENYQPGELVEALLDAGQRDRSENRFVEAITLFEAAQELDNKLSDRSFSNVIAAELTDTHNQELLDRFEAEVDELYDIIRSGEGALDAGQYQKALQRFHKVENRLPGSLAGDGATQDSYRELVERVEDGLEAAGRHRLLMLLPESPSPFERELITIAVSDSVGNKLQSIYNGTLDGSVYRNITTDDILNQVSTAATQIETYRECRERVMGAVNDTQPYLNKLDEIIQFKLHNTTLQNALVPGIEFSKALAHIQQIDDGNLDPSIKSCLQVIRKSLLNRDDLRSQAALDEVTNIIERLAEIELYTDALPSLAIDSIVEEITVAIEDGATIEQASFIGEFERIERLVMQEVESLADEIDVFLSEWEDHPAVDHHAWRNAISEARRQTDPQLLLEPYSKMQKMQGTMWNREALHQFSWSAFEQLISNLYEQQGYDTTVTPGSNDRGVDVWAENSTERVAIQVKQFADESVVGRPVIQKLESTLARGDADRIVIITSSTFANTAKQYASDSETVRLINGDELIIQLTKFDVPSSGMDTS